MATLRLLDRERSILDSKNHGKSEDRGPMPLGEALELLKSHRSESYRHTWDVRFVPTFWTDYERLDAEMKEAVILAVSALANAKHPAHTGRDLNRPGLAACEIGKSYRIVYNFMPGMHHLVLFFVGKNDDADDCEPSMAFPAVEYSKSRKADETHAEIITEGYQRDVWKEAVGDDREEKN